MNLGTVYTTILDKIDRELRTLLQRTQIKEGEIWRFGFRTGGFSPELVVAYESRTMGVSSTNRCNLAPRFLSYSAAGENE